MSDPKRAKGQATNDGRIALVNDVKVKGIHEVVIRTARKEYRCDSKDCESRTIETGESYARVIYKVKRGMPIRNMEMFHETCFNYEFVN